MCSQLQNEFELHVRAILGLAVNTGLRAPGASAVIYGEFEEQAIAFEGVDEALRVPQSDLRLFGKPESFFIAAWVWRWQTVRILPKPEPVKPALPAV